MGILVGMTSASDTKPKSRQQIVLDWYKANPGFHRCKDVAAALGFDTTHPVATASRFLWEQGKVKRRALPTGTTGRTITHYGVPGSGG